MTTSITVGALIITSALAFAAALTTVVGLYYWPKKDGLFAVKDIALAVLFAFLEPFSFYGHSDITTFSIHALVAFLVYIVTRRAGVKIAHIDDVRKDRILHS